MPKLEKYIQDPEYRKELEKKNKIQEQDMHSMKIMNGWIYMSPTLQKGSNPT